MNLFCRMSDIISANLNDLIDRCEDPEKMLRQAVREMESAIGAAMDGAAKVLANEKLLTKQLAAQQTERERWQQRAEEAVRRGDDAAARQALLRRGEHAAVVAALEDQSSAAQTVSRRLRRQIDAMRVRLAEARRKLVALAARQQAADAQKRLARTLGGAWFDDAAFGRFERLSDRVDQAEAEAEALLELTGGEPDDLLPADIEAELRELKSACGRDAE